MNTKYLDSLKEGVIIVHNGESISGKEKCSRCLLFRKVSEWHTYCIEHLTPETCEDNFQEGWTPKNILIVE